MTSLRSSFTSRSRSRQISGRPVTNARTDVGRKIRTTKTLSKLIVSTSCKKYLTRRILLLW